MSAPPLPPKSSNEYLWWSQGAADECKARDEGMSAQARELRDLAEALARQRPADSTRDLVIAVARIMCPDVLKRRYVP